MAEQHRRDQAKRTSQRRQDLQRFLVHVIGPEAAGPAHIANRFGIPISAPRINNAVPAGSGTDARWPVPPHGHRSESFVQENDGRAPHACAARQPLDLELHAVDFAHLHRGMLRDAPRYAARMSLFLASFWRAVAYCLHPRVIALSFLPLAIMVVLSLALGYFFWDPALDWVRGWMESSNLIRGASDW